MRRLSGTTIIHLNHIVNEGGVSVSKMLHIGANDGAEAKLYDEAGIEGWHVEAGSVCTKERPVPQDLLQADPRYRLEAP